MIRFEDAAANAVGIFGTPDNVKGFRRAVIDSRLVKKGDLFFAIKGENTDGHNFVRDAINRGATAAVVNKSWIKKTAFIPKGVLLIAVKDTVKSLGDTARLHRQRFQIPVLCIGGANGKTTTKDLVSAVLGQRFNVLKTEGNLNNHLGLPMTLLNLNSRHEFCVLEVGCNHYGEVSYLCDVANPDSGLVTNIGREHLEFFGNLGGVAKAEFELYDFLQKKGEGKLFLNLDDKFIHKYSTKIPNDKRITYSYSFDSDIKGKFLGYSKEFQPRIQIRSKGRKFEVQVSTFGKHSVFNGLAAAAVGYSYGVTEAKIRKALKEFRQSSSKRMEITKSNGILIINDTYNSNPDSVKIGLETLMEADVKGEKHAVLADMLELGKASKKEHSEIGKFARKSGLNNLYTFGTESFETFLSASKIKNNFHFSDKQELAELLKKRLKKGDAVYVKGSRGMKMEEVVKSITED